jgi:2-polyprenyl-3-methyl-5-hydroxy-6-metoxy-1,4-benzoquinol methylase
LKKEKWDQKYKASQDHNQEKQAALLLQENQHLLSGGKALDLAMGMGQNSIFVAHHGYTVEGVDVSAVAVSHVSEAAKKNNLPIAAFEADLSCYEIKENYFDLILNFYYLDRDLIPVMKKGLKVGGYIFFETYTREQRQFGRPRNPAYLLDANELLTSFLDHFIVFYYERIERESARPKAIASLIAQKV